MQEWPIVALRLAELMTQVEKAYDHVTLISGADDPAALALGRVVWEARTQLRAGVEMARKLRDRDNVRQESEASNGA